MIILKIYLFWIVHNIAKFVLTKIHQSRSTLLWPLSLITLLLTIMRVMMRLSVVRTLMMLSLERKMLTLGHRHTLAPASQPWLQSDHLECNELANINVMYLSSTKSQSQIHVCILNPLCPRVPTDRVSLHNSQQRHSFFSPGARTAPGPISWVQFSSTHYDDHFRSGLNKQFTVWHLQLIWYFYWLNCLKVWLSFLDVTLFLHSSSSFMLGLEHWDKYRAKSLWSNVTRRDDCERTRVTVVTSASSH